MIKVGYIRFFKHQNSCSLMYSALAGNCNCQIFITYSSSPAFTYPVPSADVLFQDLDENRGFSFGLNKKCEHWVDHQILWLDIPVAYAACMDYGKRAARFIQHAPRETANIFNTKRLCKGCMAGCSLLQETLQGVLAAWLPHQHGVYIHIVSTYVRCGVIVRQPLASQPLPEYVVD